MAGHPVWVLSIQETSRNHVWKEGHMRTVQRQSCQAQESDLSIPWSWTCRSLGLWTNKYCCLGQSVGVFVIAARHANEELNNTLQIKWKADVIVIWNNEQINRKRCWNWHAARWQDSCAYLCQLPRDLCSHQHPCVSVPVLVRIWSPGTHCFPKHTSYCCHIWHESNFTWT